MQYRATERCFAEAQFIFMMVTQMSSTCHEERGKVLVHKQQTSAELVSLHVRMLWSISEVIKTSQMNTRNYGMGK